MAYKVVFWTCVAIIAVLFVENMVSQYQAYVFFDTNSTTGMLVLVSAFFGLLCGYCFAQMMKKDSVDDDYNF